MKVVEARVTNNMLEVKINNTWLTTSLTCSENELLEYSNQANKDRVKQAIRLKEAGFSGDEVLEILGENK
jgi:hypothetical protein